MEARREPAERTWSRPAKGLLKFGGSSAGRRG